MHFWAQSDSDPGLAVVLIWVAIMAGGILIYYLGRRGERKHLRALAQELGGEFVSNFLKGGYLSLRKAEVELRVRLVPRTRYTPPYLVVEQMRPLDFRLRVEVKVPWYKRQTFFFDLLKKFTLGDPKFDEAHQVRTNDPTRAAYLLNDGRRREALANLFQHGFTIFLADKKTVQMKMPNYKDVDLSATKVREYLEKLQAITAL